MISLLTSCLQLRRYVVSLSLVLVVQFSAFAQNINRKTISEDIMALSYASMELPMDIGTALLADVKITDEAVEHYYTCKSEEIYSSFLTGYGELRLNTIAALKQMAQTSERLSLVLCVDAERNIKYHYCSPSGKSFSLTFSYSDFLSYMGAQAITPQFREDAVKLSISTLLLNYVQETHAFNLDKIDKKSVFYSQKADGYLAKGMKYNLPKACLNDLLQRNAASLYPLYSLYLEKGYNFTIIDDVNKTMSKSEVSYKDLAYIYEYVKEEQLKVQQNKASNPVDLLQESGSADEEPLPFQLIDEKPTFQGGDANTFSKWVNERLVYPQAAKKAKEQGRVVLQFTIDKEGNVTKVKVLRGVSPELDAEAVRVVSMSPAWTPGKQGGRCVAVTYTFPIIFQLP